MKKSKTRSPKWRPRSVGTMLISFVLAFFAWQGIKKTTGIELPVSDIPVDVDVPEGWAVWEKSVHRANILFRGTREDIRYLNNDQLRVVVPISNPSHQKTVKIKLTEKFLKNPTNARVVRFLPSEIMVRLDRESEKQLPVKAAMHGKLPAGIDIDRVICTPASVKVTGAEKNLKGMENIHTESISLREKYQSFTESIPIQLPQTGRMRVEPDWVTVSFALVERSETREVKKLPLQILCASGENRNISVSPTLVTVTMKGRPEILEKLDKSEILVFVSCTDLKEDTGYDVPVEVDLPSGIQLVKVDPAFVHIKINNLKK